MPAEATFRNGAIERSMHVDTRSVARAFLEDVVSGGLGAAARNHAAEDVVWWLPASTRAEPFRTLEEVLAWFDARSLHMFDEIPRMVIEGMVVEGDLAVAQMRTTGVTKGGGHYDNHYTFWIRVGQGKITEMREFYDTLHVRQVIHGG